MEQNETNIPAQAEGIVQDAAQQAQQTTQQFAGQAQQTAEQFAGQAQQTVNGYANAAQQTAQQYAGQAQQTVNNYANAAQQQYAGAQQTAQQYAGQAQQTVNGYANAAQQQYAGAQQTAQQYAGQAQQYAGQAQQYAGQYVPPVQPNPTPVNPPAKKKSKAGLIIAIIALLLAAAFCAYWFLLRTPSVENVELSQTTLELNRNGSETVYATVYPPKAAEKNEVVWTSSDSSVAAVDNNGKISAVHGGTCVITATSGGKSAKIQVNVKNTVPEEERILGVWDCIAARTSSSDNLTSMRGAGITFTFRNDLTATLHIKTDSEYTFQYTKTDEDGDVWFNIVTAAGASAGSVVLKEGDLYYVTGELGMVFER